MSEYTKEKISTFKDRFSELCDKSPMNDTAIANALNVSRQTVCSWKAGTRSPKKPTVISIANYFEVDAAWLMGFDVPATTRERIAKVFYDNLDMKLDLFSKPPDEAPKTDEARILARGIDKLSPEERAQALAVVRAMFAQHPEIFKD